MQDPDIILTKNRVMDEMKLLMSRLAARFQAGTQQDPALAQMLATGPKISRGENYEGLPWVVLDYPRYSAGDEVVFIRTMFWWGQHFSSTLQVHGPLANKIPLQDLRNTYICINEDRWQHHFRADNYRLLEDAEPRAGDFIKLARRIPIDQWAEAEEKLEQNWKDWMGLVTQAVK